MKGSACGGCRALDVGSRGSECGFLGSGGYSAVDVSAKGSGFGDYKAADVELQLMWV